MINAVFDVYGAPILAGLFIVLFVLERKFRLRRSVMKRVERVITNFIVAIPAFALLRFLFLPALIWLAVQNQQWHFGLAYWLGIPAPFKAIVFFLLLDYSNYAWHILLHRLPLLWRFHLVHHTDLDLDVSTAFRFHFGEMIASVVFRGAAVLFIGVAPLYVLIYEIAFEAATQFHHSNLRLPKWLEYTLNLVFVTPRMHGLHHSMRKHETDSNYSVIFSWWDRLHQTFTGAGSQRDIIIGVPSYPDPHELTIGQLWKMPFGRIRPWGKDKSKADQ